MLLIANKCKLKPCKIIDYGKVYLVNRYPSNTANEIKQNQYSFEFHFLCKEQTSYRSVVHRSLKVWMWNRRTFYDLRATHLQLGIDKKVTGNLDIHVAMNFML